MVFSPIVFPPASFAGAVVSANKIFVGWAFLPEDRFLVDFCEEVNISGLSARLKLRVLLAESEACAAGLVSPPSNRSKFLVFPAPAMPAESRVIEIVFEFCSLEVWVDSGERVGFSTGMVVEAILD